MPNPSAVAELRFANDRRLLSVMLWATVLPPALLTLEDALAGGAAPGLAIRALPAVVAAAALVILSRTRIETPVRTWSHWIMCVVVAALLISSAARTESELAPLRGRLLGPALIYLLVPNTVVRQAGPAIALSVGYTLLRAVRLDGLNLLTFANDALFLLVINIAGVLRIRSRLVLERALERAWTRESEARLAAERARAEVQTLEGIIPICMHCRNLRTEAGEWQRLERYVRDKTGARFSHGICPACLEAHYPEPTESDSVRVTA